MGLDGAIPILPLIPASNTPTTVIPGRQSRGSIRREPMGGHAGMATRRSAFLDGRDFRPAMTLGKVGDGAAQMAFAVTVWSVT